MVKTKEIDISIYWDTPAKVVIRKFTAGDLADIRNSIPVNMIGETQSSKPMMGDLFLLTLLKGIYSAPFIIPGNRPDMATIREIDGNLADFLVEEINKFNNIDPN